MLVNTYFSSATGLAPYDTHTRHHPPGRHPHTCHQSCQVVMCRHITHHLPWCGCFPMFQQSLSMVKCCHSMVDPLAFTAHLLAGGCIKIFILRDDNTLTQLQHQFIKSCRTAQATATSAWRQRSAAAVAAAAAAPLLMQLWAYGLMQCTEASIRCYATACLAHSGTLFCGWLRAWWIWLGRDGCCPVGAWRRAQGLWHHL